MEYTLWSIRKPPANARVMIIFDDNSRAIGYRDTFDLVHLEGGKVAKLQPRRWKKVERDEWGEYLW